MWESVSASGFEFVSEFLHLQNWQLSVGGLIRGEARKLTMSSGFGFTMESTGKSSRYSTARSTSTTKKRRNYDYEIDKLKKTNQLQKESLQEKNKKIQELSNALDEVSFVPSIHSRDFRSAFTEKGKSVVDGP